MFVDCFYVYKEADEAPAAWFNRAKTQPTTKHSFLPEERDSSMKTWKHAYFSQLSGIAEKAK